MQVKRGGGTPVTVYAAPNPAINLLQLDQLGEVLGNTGVPAGTYTAVTLTVSGNPGDILLTTSADPEPGFAAAPSTTIPTSQIQILGTSGSAGSPTVPVNLTLDPPLIVNANENTALDLEFDLSHPAFIVAHIPPGNGAITFSSCARREFEHVETETTDTCERLSAVTIQKPPAVKDNRNDTLCWQSRRRPFWPSRKILHRGPALFLHGRTLSEFVEPCLCARRAASDAVPGYRTANPGRLAATWSGSLT